MSDPVVAYGIVAFFALTYGWYAMSWALFIAYRIRRRGIDWNTSLAILLILTVGLTAVIYVVMAQAPRLENEYAYLPATYVACSFAGGLAFHAWGLLRAYRSSKRQE